jgi:hypothetical protein
MSFWTDAAVLAGAGIPSLLFGPGGAGLHSVEEYVEVTSVIACRDVLAHLAERWCDSTSNPKPQLPGVDWASKGVGRLRRQALSEDQALRRDRVPALVALEAPPRPPPADLPAGRVVAARGAAHHHAIAFEVQHRIVASNPQSTWPTHPIARPNAPAGVSGVTGFVAESCWG